MDFLPLFFDLKHKPCLLVGGGTIATRKARLLHKAQAKLIVVAPEVSAELQEMIAASGGEIHYEKYQTHHIDNVILVISATEIEYVNAQVAKDCHAIRLPVNVVDNLSLCSVIMPAIVDRSPLIMAVTSGGEAPVMARRVRNVMESSFPANYGKLAQLASRFRQAVKDAFTDGELRRRFWESVLNGPIAEKALAGNFDLAEKLLSDRIAAQEIDRGGEVYLVGAGPGDPDLLTFKALRLMQQAEVVLYDRLVSPEIVDMTRRDAERIYVGKRRANHAVEQQDINQMLVDIAKQGKRVLRLKGGDPFIFGRGGEEIELLAEHNIRFQVVPGITAASGCSSYAGIPLTHRDYSQSVRFITGHLKNEAQTLPWAEFKDNQQTLVFYMGLHSLPTICEQLIKHGKPHDTPAALVERGTLPTQKVHVSTIGELPELIKNKKIKAPTLFIVGSVVTLHDKLHWFKPESL